MKLYGYWRSTTSYRVRAALNLKGISYDTVAIDLIAGDQHSEDYTKLNPSKGVPTLVLDDGTALTQSIAIIEYIDQTWHKPKLVPDNALKRAKVMMVAYAIALDIHPVNNMRLMTQLKSQFNATQEDCKMWNCHWIKKGFTAIESMLPQNHTFAFNNTPNLADLCIVTQAYNAHRWGVQMERFHRIEELCKACLEVPEILSAHPDHQPEAKESNDKINPFMG